MLTSCGKSLSILLYSFYHVLIFLYHYLIELDDEVNGVGLSDQSVCQLPPLGTLSLYVGVGSLPIGAYCYASHSGARDDGIPIVDGVDTV